MHERVVEANRAWYAREAADYARYRSSPGFLNAYAERFAADYDLMGLSAGARVLDCCAGAGLLTGLFLDRGHPTVALDVSADMLALADDRAEKVEADVVGYLETCDRFACVALGSALHHLWDYVRVVELALDRLEPDGALYIVQEPVAHSGVGKLVREGEFVYRKLRAAPRDVLPAVRRRLRFNRQAADASAESAGELVGLYAEVHAHGIDFDRIRSAVETCGEIVMLRERRTGPVWMRAVKTLVPGYGADNFTLVARRG